MRFWCRVTEPMPSVDDPEARLQARWLATLLLIALPLGILIAAVPGLVRSGKSVLRDSDFQLALGSVALWFPIYLISRTKHYRLAGILSIILASILIFTIAIVDFEVHKINYVLMPILFGSLVLPYGIMLFYIGANLLGIVALAVFNPNLALIGTLLEPVSFVGIGAMLAMFLSYQRTRLTEYRRAKLAESEARYRGLFEDLPIAVWVEDFSKVKAYLDGLRTSGTASLARYFEAHPEAVQHCAELVEVVEVNQAAVDVAGVDEKDDLLQDLEKTIGIEAIPGFTDELIGIASGKTRVEVETVIRAASGQRRFITVTWQVVPGYEDTLRRCLVSTIDVTEQKLAERALRESEQRYRVLFESTGTATCVFGQDRVIRLCNGNFESLVGLPKEDILGVMRWSDFVAPEDIPRMERYHAQRGEGSGTPPNEYEFTLINARGERRNIYLQLGLVKGTGERIASLVDVTDRKRREEQLSFQSMLLDQIQDMVTATDLEGRITYVNAAECRAFGKPPDAFIGQSIESYGEDPERGATQQDILETTLREGRWRGEVVNITDDGREIILDSRTNVIYNDDGEPVGLLGVSTDITERKVMERQLVQQERLAAVGQLAAGIAHDFRNLLSTIILYTEMDLRKPDLPASLARHLKIISQESHTASDLIQQILDFSSNAMLNRRALDLEAHVEKVLITLQHTIPESIRMSLRTEGGDYTILADPARIQQAVTNLVLNARDAMPHGGELQFALSRSNVSFSEDSPGPDATADSWVCLTVSDTGVGMDEEVQAHLFEPFFTTKETGKGTGLGLAQVFGIVRQHEGHIDVETEPGEGTTFRIYLPAQDVEVAEEPSERPSPIPQGRGETVLLVEDEAEVRDAIEQVLTSTGYRVVTAKHGGEALALCRSPAQSVDVVVTDLVMPEMGGKQLLKALQTVTPDLPVVAITGYAVEGKRQDALVDSGFVDVISKPLDVERLARTLRQVLDDSR